MTTTTYTATATGSGGTATCAATVTVTVPPGPPTCTLGATPASIPSGSAATLSWTTSNATSLVVNQGVGSVTPVAAGTRSVTPVTTTTYTATATGSGGTATCSVMVTVTGSVPVVWNSWEVATQGGGPRRASSRRSGAGTVAAVEFYESTNNGGVAKGGLFGSFVAGPHPDVFNALNLFLAAEHNQYSYTGKSTISRGSGPGESNTPSPTGVLDLQLHPPANDHSVVAAFSVPLNGTYVISGIAVRRVSSLFNHARLRVFNAQQTQLVVLNATKDRDWVQSSPSHTLTSLTAGQFIYFAVDRNGSNSNDATEVSWTITWTGP